MTKPTKRKAASPAAKPKKAEKSVVAPVPKTEAPPKIEKPTAPSRDEGFAYATQTSGTVTFIFGFLIGGGIGVLLTIFAMS